MRFGTVQRNWVPASPFKSIAKRGLTFGRIQPVWAEAKAQSGCAA
jgi:hypothetical protein